MARNDALFEAVTKGKRNDVTTIVQQALDDGRNAEEIVNDTMIPAMREIGERFSRHEVYVPEMLIAARAMTAGLKLLEPVLAAAGHQPLGKVCIGTVKGDLHDIGKNLVVMMLKGAGYEVVDLGVDCDVAKFDQGVAEGATLVLASALLTTTMPYMKQVVEHFQDRPGIRVVVGGAPVTQAYADEIGAAGYGGDANDAVAVVDRLVQAA
jgi:5-methyltetrahydrofolate--homocysteine methyltransferase